PCRLFAAGRRPVRRHRAREHRALRRRLDGGDHRRRQARRHSRAGARPAEAIRHPAGSRRRRPVRRAAPASGGGACTARPAALARVRDRAGLARPGRPAWIGGSVAAAFAPAMTMWGTLAPISGAAIASGNLQVEGRRQSVQHPYGGVVRQLTVRDGARVEKGQLLIRLDDSDPRAKLDVLNADRDAALAARARLMAERDRSDAPDFDEGLRARSELSAVRQAMANETAMMAARKHQFAAETAVLRGKIKELESQIIGTQAQLAGTEKQRELLTDEMNGAQHLFAQGYTPKTRILALQREDAKLQADIGAQQASIAGMQQQIAQNDLEIARVERARMSEITDQLRATA